MELFFYLESEAQESAAFFTSSRWSACPQREQNESRGTRALLHWWLQHHLPLQPQLSHYRAVPAPCFALTPPGQAPSSHMDAVCFVSPPEHSKSEMSVLTAWGFCTPRLPGSSISILKPCRGLGEWERGKAGLLLRLAQLFKSKTLWESGCVALLLENKGLIWSSEVN